MISFARIKTKDCISNWSTGLCCYLPMPERKPKLDFNEFLALANPEISAKLVDACAAAYLETARAMRSVFATRIFENAH